MPGQAMAKAQARPAPNPVALANIATLAKANKPPASSHIHNQAGSSIVMLVVSVISVI
jgi:hypothetical protein